MNSAPHPPNATIEDQDDLDDFLSGDPYQVEVGHPNNFKVGDEIILNCIDYPTAQLRARITKILDDEEVEGWVECEAPEEAGETPNENVIAVGHDALTQEMINSGDITVPTPEFEVNTGDMVTVVADNRITITGVVCTEVKPDSKAMSIKFITAEVRPDDE